MMVKMPRSLTGLMIVLVGVMWGLNWPSVKFMLAEVPPLTLRAGGFSAAALLLSAIALAVGQSMRPAKGEAVSLVLTSLFVLFGFNMLTAMGQLFTPASNAALIAYTMPSLTAVLSVVFLGEVLHRRLVLAIGIGLAGLMVLASANLPALLAQPLGPAIMLGAALSWSIGNILMQLRKWTLHPLARTAWFFIIAAILTWPLVFVFEPLNGFSMPSAASLWVFAFHVCGPLVACYVLWTVLLSRLSATVAAISTLIAPVVGVLSSVILLGDELSWQKGLALVLIVASIVMTLLKPTQKRT
ncbi:drug/metabolite transporter (DMT)-like permease [Sulfitobacter undariae]|uniref:Drug/metabolite transporter (DMT)-like permease n=2 Tax=Sulfitobacter undariae TaxID=1563671 RepID=A0A7W6H2L6_9RHOB|nr:drug/metabolite transporter (DMT)-like permease [Sulfitobacter undariae]